jgi:hypothetical protein
MRGGLSLVRTRRGARLLHGRHVLSEVLAEPGATKSVFDLLAAACFVLAPPGPLAMLGFAAGGVLAPLRALGSVAKVCAVDLSLAGAPIFWQLSRSWAGRVQLSKAEASSWLSRRRERFACVLEDLSEQIPGDVTKPAVCLGPLPGIIARRLARGGVVVINGLPAPGRPWAQVQRALTAPYAQVAQLSPEGYENQVLVAGEALPSARALRAQLVGALEFIGSPLARGLVVRRLR